MLNLFKADPTKKLRKAYESTLSKALHAQRNGDLRTHGTLMAEAAKIYEELKAQERHNS